MRVNVYVEERGVLERLSLQSAGGPRVARNLKSVILPARLGQTQADFLTGTVVGFFSPTSLSSQTSIDRPKSPVAKSSEVATATSYVPAYSWELVGEHGHHESDKKQNNQK